MTDKLKSYLGYALIISVLIVALSAFMYARTYSRMVEPGNYRTFAVVGEGKAVVVPDVAEFSFSVVTEGGKDLATLQTQNTDKANKAVAYVKSQGVDAKDIRTEGYNVQPRYQYSNCGYVNGGVCPPPEIVGYTVQQTVSVKARDFSKVGPMLAGVVNNGANTVSQLNFTVDDPTEVQNEARGEAIAKAQAKARAIAKAGDFNLGRLISIEENGGPSVPMFYNKEMMMDGRGGVAQSAPTPSIEPGSNEVQVGVTLRYEIN